MNMVMFGRKFVDTLARFAWFLLSLARLRASRHTLVTEPFVILRGCFEAEAAQRVLGVTAVAYQKDLALCSARAVHVR